MLKVLIISFFVLLLPTQSFCKELNNKIKFHPPETEAEKALDEILKAENGIIKDRQNVKEDILTKDFLKEELGQKKYYEECQKENVWCNKRNIETFFNVNHITQSRYLDSNHVFFYLTNKETKMNGVYIDVYFVPKSFKKNKNDNLHLSRDSFDFQYGTIHYVVKKENGKWKIDGICHGGFKINYQACYLLGTIDYNDIDSYV